VLSAARERIQSGTGGVRLRRYAVMRHADAPEFRRDAARYDAVASRYRFDATRDTPRCHDIMPRAERARR